MSRDLLRLKTVRLETAQCIADVLLALGYAVHFRQGPIGLVTDVKHFSLARIMIIRDQAGERTS
jgi:hypothetical protein